MTSQLLLPIATACQQHVFEQKWLLAPTHRIGNQWKDCVNLAGVDTINLRTVTVKSLALGIVSDELVSRGLQFASQDRCVLVVGSILEQLAKSGELTYLVGVDSIHQLAHLVARSIADLRMADVSPDRFEPTYFEVAEKAADLELIAHKFDEELARQKLLDYPACLRRATEFVASSTAALPDPLVIVQPLENSAGRLEENLLAALGQRGKVFGPTPSADGAAGRKISFAATFFRAIGEVNEVNLVFQTLLGEENRTSLDQVEILHTDYSTYVPLIHETLTQILPAGGQSIDDLPVTFGEGLACIYSRPGRALRSWLRWIRSGYLQTLAVQMVREGLLKFDENRDGVGFTQLAHRLRELPIGLAGGRYGVRIGDAINQAHASMQRVASSSTEEVEFQPGYDFGLAVYEILASTLPPLISASPDVSSTSLDLLAAAQNF